MTQNPKKMCFFTLFVDEETIMCSQDGDFDFNGVPVNECSEFQHCEIIAEKNKRS